ncbi:hypothetical protein [Marinicella sediminis]|nr:hypothetical protein [Marinicella sediminis]
MPAGTALLLSVTDAMGHGGLSSLEGMFELVLMVYLQGFILMCWLVFVGIFVFKQHVSAIVFRRFRQVMYGLTALLMLLVVNWLVDEGFNPELLVIALSVLTGAVIITEATVWVTRLLRGDLRS